MTKQAKKHDGRTGDLRCTWLTRSYGQEWEPWRSYADSWLHAHHAGISHRREAISWFLESYLVRHHLPAEPAALFAQNLKLPDIAATMAKTIHSEFHGAKQQNHIVKFIDWVIAKDFSEPNDQGIPIPLVANPFAHITPRGGNIETVWNALPYSYLRELRTILCPDPHGNFRDWRWAHEQTGRETARGKMGSWFEVDSSFVDIQDPDCVWRERSIYRKGRRVTLTQIWSPVHAIALLVKLYLPLRTYQVRMLESAALGKISPALLGRSSPDGLQGSAQDSGSC
ncbi:MAG: VPA1269 family protein [Terriglobia bacterium]